MLGEVIALRARSPHEPARLPLVVQPAPGAVQLDFHELELWASPDQAEELAEALVTAAREARRLKAEAEQAKGVVVVPVLELPGAPRGS